MHVDPEFEMLQDAITDNDITVHWVPAQKQVPEIERTIRTVKDGHRCAYEIFDVSQKFIRILSDIHNIDVSDGLLNLTYGDLFLVTKNFL